MLVAHGNPDHVIDKVAEGRKGDGDPVGGPFFGRGVLFVLDEGREGRVVVIGDGVHLCVGARPWVGSAAQPKMMAIDRVEHTRKSRRRVSGIGVEVVVWECARR